MHNSLRMAVTAGVARPCAFRLGVVRLGVPAGRPRVGVSPPAGRCLVRAIQNGEDVGVYVDSTRR